MQKWFICLLLLFSFRSFAEITIEDLGKVIESFHKEYDSQLKEQGAVLLINPSSDPNRLNMWWDFDQVHASYSSYYDADTKIFTHYLYVMGGYARLPAVTRDGVVATLCHELGHGIAGPPYKVDPFEKFPVSVEGQADYFAYHECVPRIFRRLDPASPVKPVNEFAESQCRKVNPLDYAFCLRAFQTLESERAFFRLDPEDPNSEYEQFDPTVVSVTNTDPYFLPSSQCRLDTMMRAILGKPRPACWYADPEFKVNSFLTTHR